MSDFRNMYSVFEARVRKFDPVTKVATVVMPGVYGMEPFEAPPFTRSGMDPAVIENLVVGDRVLVVQGENEVPEWLSTNPDWYRAADTRYVNVAGDTMTGDLTINSPYALNFQAATRQMINMYTGTYGIGIQGSAMYFRCNTNSDFVWFNGGVHNDVNENPGAGGTERMVLRPDGLYLTDTNDDRYFNIGNSTTSGARLTMSLPFIGNSVFIDFMGWGAAGTEALGFRNGSTLQTILELQDTVIMANKPLYNTGQIRAAGSVNPLVLIDAGNGPYMTFYDGLSVNSVGNRKGYVGFASPTILNLYNEMTNGELRLNTVGSGSSITFYTGNAFDAKFDILGNFLFNKTTYNTYDDTVGGEWWPGGQFFSTMSAASVNMELVHVASSAADANGVSFLRFYRGAAILGNITQLSTTGVNFSQTSHAPWKGNVQDLDDDEALKRLSRWRPIAFQWKYDENGMQDEDGTPSGDFEHGFIAQEMYEIQPSAVTRGHGLQSDQKVWLERRAMHRAAQEGRQQIHDAWAEDEPGTRGVEPELLPDFTEEDPFMPWMGDWSKLVPDMVAAMQAMMRQIEALQGEVAELRRSAPNN